MAGPKANGQSVSPSEPPTLSENLSQAEQTLTLLVRRLEERQKQVADLLANSQIADGKLRDLAESLASLRLQLESAQASLEKSQSELTVTSLSLQSLSMRYDELERKWLAYRSEMKTQVDTLERDYARARRWAIGFGVSTAVGFIVSVVLALR
jgi:chromosome segregation ATPase